MAFTALEPQGRKQINSTMIRETVGKIFGLASIAITLISIPLNVVSGIGVFVALFGLVLAGVSVLVGITKGVAKHAMISLGIATASIFIISPLSLTQNLPLSMVVITLIPYLFLIAALIFHFIQRKPT